MDGDVGPGRSDDSATVNGDTPDRFAQVQRRHQHGAVGQPPHPHRAVANAVTHPELLAVASLLLTARRRDVDAEREVLSRLGFPYQPFPGEPLALSLLDPRKDNLY